MIEQLFGSKTRVKLLQLFYQNPNRSFYVREITRKIDEQINSVRRELANLLSIGIITSDNNNNRLYYEVNQSFEHFAALESIFGSKHFTKAKIKKNTQKVNEEEIATEVIDNEDIDTKDPFVVELIKTGNVRMAVYTGQFTRDDTVSVDLVVVGDINHSAVDNLIQELEKAEKKSIRYSIFDPAEFEYRRQVNDRFVSDLIASKKVILIDKDKVLK